ncbi:MAG: bifunctional methylenetetrahydrofolate dehydrogenase/methenyltetrahydrofolate cyclohydrolase [Mycoplasma sp.]
MSLIIDGKLISSQIKNELKDEVLALKNKGVIPTLAVIQIGDVHASNVYIRNKKKAAEDIGIKFIHFQFNENIDNQTLLEKIGEINNDQSIHGLFVQLPLPKHINENDVINKINPNKDVDCFSLINIGKLWTAKKDNLVIKPCTPAGIIELLKRSNVELSGKDVVIVGRSNIVGKPLGALFLLENATVTICHSRSKDLANICKKADVLVSAVGISKFIKKDFIKQGAVVVDVGINRNEEGKICGDVDFENVKSLTSKITPVPGGVGPMTVAMLMKNLVQLTKLQNK